MEIPLRGPCLVPKCLFDTKLTCSISAGHSKFGQALKKSELETNSNSTKISLDHDHSNMFQRVAQNWDTPLMACLVQYISHVTSLSRRNLYGMILIKEKSRIQRVSDLLSHLSKFVIWLWCQTFVKWKLGTLWDHYCLTGTKNQVRGHLLHVEVQYSRYRYIVSICTIPNCTRPAQSSQDCYVVSDATNMPCTSLPCK